MLIRLKGLWGPGFKVCMAYKVKGGICGARGSYVIGVIGYQV